MNKIEITCSNAQIEYYIERELNNIKRQYELMKSFEDTLKIKKKELEEKEKELSDKENNILSREEIIDENPIFKKNIRELNLSARCFNALRMEGIEIIGDVLKNSKFDLLKIPNIGKGCLQEIRIGLENMGLSLKE